MPPLRFREFRDTEGWVYLNGDKAFEPISNKNHNSDLPILAISQEYGAIPRDEIDYSVIVTDKSVESYKVIEVGDFIISLRSFQGGIEYSNYKGICSPAYIILRKKIDIDDIFFKIYFKTHLFIQDLNKNLEGIRDGKMVSYKQFSEILLPTPSVTEQQKIAACLSSIDDLITAQSAQVAALKNHKKGLLQQLFPAEGETVPRLRFAEFKDTEGWEERQLKDICKINPLVDKLPDSFVYIDLESVVDGTLLRKKILNLKSSPSRAQRLLQFGDIIFQTVRPYQKNNYFFQTKDSLDYVASTGYAQLRAYQSNGYLFQYLHNQRFVDRVLEKSTGSSYPAINSNDLFEILVEIPPSVKEQQKIAICLSSIDDLIQSAIERLATLKAHKKGLMQQLFPNSDAGI